MKTFDFMHNHITPKKVAEKMERKEPFHVDLPLRKVERFMKAFPRHFHGQLRTTVVARNARAREVFAGTVMGGLLGLGVGVGLKVIRKTHWSIAVATTLVGMGIGYFTVRYNIDYYIRLDSDGEEYAKLKFKPT